MLRKLGIVLFAAMIGCAPSRARGLADWDLLGTRQVNDRVDHDVIAVTSTRGDFRRIKITVQRASVDFHRVVVHFGNGGDQRIEMRWNANRSCEIVGRAVNELHHSASGRAIFSDHPLQRGYQDVQGALGHAFLVGDSISLAHGASKLGGNAMPVMA